MTIYQVEVLVKANVTVEVEAESEVDARCLVEDGLILHNCVTSLDTEFEEGEVIDLEPWYGFEISHVDEQGGTK